MYNVIARKTRKGIPNLYGEALGSRPLPSGHLYNIPLALPSADHIPTCTSPSINHIGILGQYPISFIIILESLISESKIVTSMQSMQKC